MGQASRAQSYRVPLPVVVVLAGLLAGVPSAEGAVWDLTVTDVTPRSFSLVWASDESVDNASVSVFADAEGTVDLTATVGTSLVSADFPPALAQGVVKLTVTGLDADTCVHVRTSTQSASGSFFSPEAPDTLEVCTAVALRKSDDLGNAIVNDVVVMELVGPDGVTPAAGALLLVDIPELVDYPLSTFMGEGFGAPLVGVNLNNFFDAATGESIALQGGDRLTITEFRGRLCAVPDDHRLIRFRVVPSHEEVPTVGAALTELEDPVPCFFKDTVCDETINILDAQRILNRLTASLGECAYNSELDLVADGDLNILDVQSVLNSFGQDVPVTP